MFFILFTFIENNCHLFFYKRMYIIFEYIINKKIEITTSKNMNGCLEKIFKLRKKKKYDKKKTESRITLNSVIKIFLFNLSLNYFLTNYACASEIFSFFKVLKNPKVHTTDNINPQTNPTISIVATGVPWKNLTNPSGAITI